MRIVHTFKYHNKEFRAWEPLVRHYLMFIRDPFYTIDFLIQEYNKEKPKLTPRQYKRFINIMFDSKTDVMEALTGKSKLSEKQKKKLKQYVDDMHIRVSFVWKQTHLPVLDLPLPMFWKILEDLEYISWSKKYERNRKSTEPDHDKIKQLQDFLAKNN